MAFSLPALPFADTALAPAVSAETLSYHHGKHHQAYVDKMNAAIEGTDHDNAALEDVVAAARGSNQGLFNNAAQTWNHAFYWHSMAPESTAASDELQTMIGDAFGSLDGLKEKLAERGAGHFASGWVWLAEKDGKLSIEETHDGDTLADSEFNPLLTIDVWEHAYYLDHQNKRPAYLDAVINGKLNLAFASENLARGTTWKFADA
ncbi:superoxide dismutase [Pontixanthobacter aestiaquae]|uniref:Superoxide dismutase n=1 Tax=Pontixanthobacter aestiaquae TaxID=1509367 RepID=A0A844Z643_9SPHN|nr:superoxide dismutase [Pontixanthobacter aestiaquae]MDN3646465.1 superoxide dismutase [Pontixanthobacter aestiaquae]MXO82547.1 superoxide dismutase [Fe] [Pontixanthobacter aestiaquae]